MERFNVLPPDRRPDFWRWVDAQPQGSGARLATGLAALTETMRWRVWTDMKVARPTMQYRLTGHDVEYIRDAIIAAMTRAQLTHYHVSGQTWAAVNGNLYRINTTLRPGCF